MVHIVLSICLLLEANPDDYVTLENLFSCANVRNSALANCGLLSLITSSGIQYLKFDFSCIVSNCDILLQCHFSAFHSHAFYFFTFVALKLTNITK